MPHCEVRTGRLYMGGVRVPMIASPHTQGRFVRPPRVLVIHYTRGSSAASSAQWFRDPRNPGSSAHLVIDRDGSIIQCVDLGVTAMHAGKSRWNGVVGLNRHSIGIELANWGHLVRTDAGWASYTGAPVRGVVMAAHRQGNPDRAPGAIGWEAFPEAQLASAVAAARALVAGGIAEIVGHDDIAPGRKFDPGPAFDMAAFRAAVFGGVALAA